MDSLNKIYSLMERIDGNFRQYRAIITEDKRSKQSKARCLNVLRAFFNNAQWLDTEFVHQDNPEHLSHIDYILKQFVDEFYHTPELKSGPTMRLMPLILRLALEMGFQQSNPDQTKLGRLKRILEKILALSKKGEPVDDIDINNTTFEQLDAKYGKAIDDEYEADKVARANKQHTVNDSYRIIGPVDYDTAHGYGERSCPSSKLCYTQNPSTWDQYTQGGINNAYIILKDGWENIPPKHDDGNGDSDTGSPYDTYGLSMIFVFVGPDGSLVKSNTRWNHRAAYRNPGCDCDHAFTEGMIEDLVGRNFEATFKPNNKWKNAVEDAMRRLANGEKPRNIFDKTERCESGIIMVRLCGRWNFIGSDGKLLSPNLWFDDADDFYEGFASVEINEKGYNYLKPDGGLLSPNQWFDNVFNFRNGFARVKIKSKGWNFLKPDGKLLSPNQWFDGAWNFSDGFALVKIDGKGYNYLKPDGGLLSPNQWFVSADDFYNGFARVYINGKGWNYLKTDGKLISPDLWFDYAWNFSDGFASVEINGKGYNYLKPDGKLLSPNQWFDGADDFYDGFAVVYIKGKGYNYLKPDGKLLCPNQWFDIAWDFSDGFAKVHINGKGWYNLDSNGKIVPF